MMKENLKISNLTVKLGKSTIFQNVTLPIIQSHAITVIAGPNGAGKSTILRAIAGLVPASGSVLWGSEDLFKISTPRRANLVGFMPQTISSQSGLTVLESVIASARLYHLNDNDQIHQINALEILEMLGIISLSMQPLYALSGGQRQIANLAQSLVRKPKILLLDEPTSALDLRHQIEVMSILKTVEGEGSIIVVVLHDLNLVARWADQVIFLNEGKVISCGTANEVLTPNLVRQVYNVQASTIETANGKNYLVIEDIL